jgi:hypothetical protein
MVRSSPTRTLSSSTTVPSSCPWPTLAPTRTFGAQATTVMANTPQQRLPVLCHHRRHLMAQRQARRLRWRARWRCRVLQDGSSDRGLRYQQRQHQVQERPTYHHRCWRSVVSRHSRRRNPRRAIERVVLFTCDEQLQKAATFKLTSHPCSVAMNE